eukprot:7261498-Ditylum_brightwellii.AAC.1
MQRFDSWRVAFGVFIRMCWIQISRTLYGSFLAPWLPTPYPRHMSRAVTRHSTIIPPVTHPH